jgi:type I restriction enzyme R subunit
VRGAPSDKVLTDIISLVRFSTDQADVLEPYSAPRRATLQSLDRPSAQSRSQFYRGTDELAQAIKDYLAANVEIKPADLMRDQPFSEWGGIVAARNLFGAELNGMLDELSEALAA